MADKDKKDKLEQALHDPNKKTQKDYDESDVKHVFKQSNFMDWSDIVKWLQNNGESDNELTPGEVEHMLQDFKRLENRHESFTNDPMKAYKMAHQSR